MNHYFTLLCVKLIILRLSRQNENEKQWGQPLEMDNDFQISNCGKWVNPYFSKPIMKICYNFIYDL